VTTKVTQVIIVYYEGFKSVKKFLGFVSLLACPEAVQSCCSYWEVNISKVAEFARKVANDYLKTDLKVLNRYTFKDLQPEIDQNTPIVLEKGFTIGDHQQGLQKMIKERDMIILVNNVSLILC